MYSDSSSVVAWEGEEEYKKTLGGKEYIMIIF